MSLNGFALRGRVIEEAHIIMYTIFHDMQYAIKIKPMLVGLSIVITPRVIRIESMTYCWGNYYPNLCVLNRFLRTESSRFVNRLCLRIVCARVTLGSPTSFTLLLSCPSAYFISFGRKITHFIVYKTLL